MLKRISFAVMFLFACFPAEAQKKDPWETYLNRVYGSPYIQTLQIGDKAGTITGCRFGWIATDRVRLGFVTAGVMPFARYDSGIPAAGGGTLDYFFSYMGFEAEYVLKKGPLLFYSAAIHTGSGKAGTTNTGASSLNDVGVIQYGLDAGICLGKNTIICLGIANRSASNFSNANLDSGKLSGVTYSLIFKFGDFR